MPFSSAVIIGAGNIASHMARILPAAKYKIVQVCNRSPEKAAALAATCGAAYTTDYSNLAQASIYIIAVSDSAIPEVVKQMPLLTKLVVHTSGSTPVDVLSKFPRRGVFYPLQTLTAGVKPSEMHFPVLTEASSQAGLRELNTIAGLAGLYPVQMNSEDRMKVHTAAVFTCNFTNHLIGISEKILLSAGQDLGLLKALASETIHKAFSKGPSDAQTGPALRGDRNTMRKHLKLLAADPKTQNIYRLLSKSLRDEHQAKRTEEL